MQQLTIFDFINESKLVLDEVFAIIRRYLINYKSDELFPYEIDDYSRILNDKTKIAVTCITFNFIEMVFYNDSAVYKIRFFKSSCIIDEDKKGTHNYGVWYEVCFHNYNEFRQLQRLKEFIEFVE